MDKFYKLSEDTIADFLEIFNTKAFPIPVDFQFIGNEKQKDLIKITKINDVFCFVTKKSLLVSINEHLMDVFDEESIKILIEQELDKISMDSNSGKIKIIKYDLSTFSSIITKYGVEKVAKANQVTELYHQQVKDGQELIA